MKFSVKLIALGALMSLPTFAAAECYGSGSYYSCYDTSGNTYNVQRYGNTTSVQGYNSQSGSSWSQDSYRSGNMTQTFGRAADGNAWNSTTITSPGMSNTFGTDSNGNSFSTTCTSLGCW